MSNADYLQPFRNVADISSALGGHLYDHAVLELVIKEKNGPSTMLTSLTVLQQKEAEDLAMEQYLGLSLIQQADCRRFGKLSENLENDYTKGMDNYPRNTANAYQLLIDYKNSHNITPDILGSSS